MHFYGISAYTPNRNKKEKHGISTVFLSLIKYAGGRT